MSEGMGLMPRRGISSLSFPFVLIVIALSSFLVQVLPQDIPLPEDCAPPISGEQLWNNSYEYGKSGLFDEARVCFERYVSENPVIEKGWCLLSEIHARIGNPDGALSHSRVAARLGGETANGSEGLFLLANAYMGLHEYGKARQHYYKAIRLDPTHVSSMVNLGVVLGNNNDYAEAIPIYRKALEIKPDIMAARHNLGSALHTLKLFPEALQILESLVADEPACFECLLSLGHTLAEAKYLSRAKEMYRRGMEVKPHDPDALLNYYHTKQQVIDWEERDHLFERLKNVTESQLAHRHLTTVGPYYSLLSPYDQEQMMGIAESHAIKAYDKIKYLKDFMPPTFGLELEPPIYRLRVGYIMADFRHHVTAHLLQTVFLRHDEERFEVFCYALNKDDRSAFRFRIRQSVGDDHFRDMSGIPDHNVAITVNNDLVDLLIDTDYYKSRLSILALRPAPIQVNFLAHPGTSGAAFVDHIVADRIVAPPDHALFFSESILYMSHHYQVNDHRASYPPRRDRTVAQIRQKEGLPLGKFVFCNFNGLYKIEPAAFELWVRIMHRVPDSVLWLVNENSESNANIVEQARLRGISEDRLILAQRADFAEHIDRVRGADMFLDCFTYNAHTTAVDSLWGGLPVMTLPGHNMNMRLAAGALYAYGPASETCVRTIEDYEEVAVAIANPAAKRRIRRRLFAKWTLAGVEELGEGGREGGGGGEGEGGREGDERDGLETRPLFDTEGWVRDFEGGLLMMAELSAAEVGRGETEAQFYAGSGAGGMGRRPHLIRAHSEQWGPPSRLY